MSIKTRNCFMSSSLPIFPPPCRSPLPTWPWTSELTRLAIPHPPDHSKSTESQIKGVPQRRLYRPIEGMKHSPTRPPPFSPSASRKRTWSRGMDDEHIHHATYRHSHAVPPSPSPRPPQTPRHTQPGSPYYDPLTQSRETTPAEPPKNKIQL